MAKHKESKDVEPFNHWFCEGCKTEALTHPEMMTHLHEKHSCPTEKIKGKRSMRMHMDGDTWFDWQYDWEIESPSGLVKLLQHTRSRRAKDDMMRWA